MRFCLSWLKKYLDTSADIPELTTGLTQCGLEVEHVETYSALDPFIVAKIITLAPHPQADRLQCCQVDVGGGHLRQIVCGARNIFEGMVGVLAPVGTFIPGLNVHLKLAKIRSVESQGMLCSAEELGLDVPSPLGGVIQLPSTCTPGSSAKSALGLDDPLFDIAITPNRPDCFGVKGIARDLAARGLGTFHDTENAHVPIQGNPCPMEISVEDTENCPFILFRPIWHIKDATMPEWLAHSLKAAGAKSIHPAVDVTNYLCFDRARPLHAYDLDKIDGSIVVRPSQAGEPFEALDGQHYTLPEGLCVVADRAGVLALAGVMGGKRSAVSQTTRHVLLESAFFAPRAVARAGQELGIHSQSRTCFERGVDPESLEDGIERATTLITTYMGGQAGAIHALGSPPKRTVVPFEAHMCASLAGISVSEERQKQLLEAIGCRFLNAAIVEVPSFRPDLTLPCDLVAEVVRLHGLETLKTIAPQVEPVQLPHEETVHKTVRTLLAAMGLMETVNWAFIDSDMAHLFTRDPNSLLRLKNPIATNMCVMRPSLLPNLLATVARHEAQFMTNTAFFEVGKTFALGPDAQPQEEIWVAGIRINKACLNQVDRHWFEKSRLVTLWDAKRDLTTLIEGIAPNCTYTAQVGAPAWYHPKASGRVLVRGRKEEGTFGCLHPRIVRQVGLGQASVVAFELPLSMLIALSADGKGRCKKAWKEATLHKIGRDFAFVVESHIPAESVTRAVWKASALIDAVHVFDIFEHPSLGAGKKSVGLEVLIQPQDVTPTAQELETIAAQIIKHVCAATGAQLRA